MNEFGILSNDFLFIDCGVRGLTFMQNYGNRIKK